MDGPSGLLSNRDLSRIIPDDAQIDNVLIFCLNTNLDVR